jgi:hypothetical protein
LAAALGGVAQLWTVSFDSMKTLKPVCFVLLFAGIFLMSFFGSYISRSVENGTSWTTQFMLPSYSLVLILISSSMFWLLASRVRDLEAKIRNLESNGR